MPVIICTGLFMKKKISVLFLLLIFSISSLFYGCGNSTYASKNTSNKTLGTWKAFHMRLHYHKDVEPFGEVIEKVLVPMGVNVIILEINEGFDFKSHPEVSVISAVTKPDARKLSAICKKNNIRLIPMFNCLGHQGWLSDASNLLKSHPSFDETPHLPLDTRELVYCRSWCPLNPDVNKVVFDLIDELIDAFEADAFHVGMDEVFELGNKHCKRCSGKKPSELFAKSVNDLYKHIVKKNKVEMLMWGDRLINTKGTKYGDYEADSIGIWPAVDKIPKDIIICDWHYNKMDKYPSVDTFLEKGFRVLPTTWKNPIAATAFLDYSQNKAKELNKNPQMLGMLVGGFNASGTSMYDATLNPKQVKNNAVQDSKYILKSLEAVTQKLK